MEIVNHRMPETPVVTIKLTAKEVEYLSELLYDNHTTFPYSGKEQFISDLYDALEITND